MAIGRSLRRGPRPARHLAWPAVALAAVLAVSACSSSGGGAGSGSSAPPKSGVAHLTFWSWVPNIGNAVNLFNKTHKNIQVSLDTIPTGSNGGYAKMLAAVKAGNGPCDAQVEYQELPTFVVQGALVDIKQYASASQSLFVPWQWQQGVFNGGVYAIPQASGPMGLFYNKKVWSAAGVTSPPKTWAQFAADAAKIHAKNPKDYITSFEADNSAWFASLAWQLGTNWFGTSGDSWTVNIDNPASVKVASYWSQLVKQGVVKTESSFTSPWYKDLQTGAISSWIGASWGDAIIRQNAPHTSGDWAVAPMPQWSAAAPFASANWGGSSTAVLKGCSDPAAATQFAVWLNSNKQSMNLLVTDGYGWPAVPDVSGIPAITNDPAVFKFYNGQNINTVFAQADQHINESWGWIPNVTDTYNTLNSAFTSASAGKGTFTGALATAQKATVSQLKSAGLSVAGG
jgi:multiple sugar transport system substrate-binding protein